MEPEGPLPHSQEHAACPSPEPDQSSRAFGPTYWRGKAGIETSSNFVYPRVWKGLYGVVTYELDGDVGYLTDWAVEALVIIGRRSKWRLSSSSPGYYSWRPQAHEPRSWRRRGPWTRPVTEPVLYLLSFLRPSLLFCFLLCEGVVTVEYGYSGGHNNARTARN